MKYFTTAIFTLLSITLVSNAESSANLDELRVAAEKGNIEAQIKLGSLYSLGNSAPRDYAESVKWFRMAAEQGNSEAQYNLGLMYAVGKRTHKDRLQTASLKRKLIFGYRGQAPYNDYTESIKWLRLAAEQGNTDAQNVLGNMYLHGDTGLPQSFTESLKLLHLAAEEGNRNAQYNLGIMYSTGRGVERDPQVGIKWLHKAAMQGDVSAQTFMAMMYSKKDNRSGITTSYFKAYLWYNIAAALGYEGTKSGDNVAEKLTSEQIAEAQRLSLEWLAKHSEKNK